MMKQSGIKVPAGVYVAASSINFGTGAAAQVINGTRSATDVRTLGGNGRIYGKFSMPVTLDIDLSGLGLGY